MKKLTAGIFTVLMGLVSVNAADAAVASKGYVDKLDREQGELVETNTENIAKNAAKIGNATFTGANYVSGATDLTAAVAALDTAVNNVAGGELQLGSNAVDSGIIKNGEVKTDDIADSAVTDAKIANNAVTETKIANNAVTETKIADKAVTANKLSDNLSATISGKADKATTLGGYGIADAYTKTEADDKFIDTTEIEGYATDAELAGVSNVANAADTLSKTNQSAITVLNGDVSVEGSVKKQIKDTSDATLEAAKDYTDQKVDGLNLAEISRVPAACGAPGNYCTLTTNGTNFVWEVIARGDAADEVAPSDQPNSDRLQVTVPPVTEPAVTQ